MDWQQYQCIAQSKGGLMMFRRRADFGRQVGPAFDRTLNSSFIGEEFRGGLAFIEAQDETVRRVALPVAGK